MDRYHLSEVDLNLTSRCNLHCAFCSAEIVPASRKDRDLPLAKVASLFDEFDALGVGVVRLVGGEPFLHSDINEIVRLAGKRRFLTRVLTNGTVMSEQHLHLMKEEGVDLVAFSVDGHVASIHNSSRGSSNSFARLQKMIICCSEIRMRHRMMSAVTPKVLKIMKELIAFGDEHRFELVNFIVLGLSGEMKVDPEHFPTFRDALIDLTLYMRDHPPRAQVTFLFPHENPVPYELYQPLRDAGLLHLLKSIWRIDYERHPEPLRNGMSRCHAGHDGVSILPNGDVFGCDLMRGIPDFCAGNIWNQSLADIFDHSPVLAQLRSSRCFERFAPEDEQSRVVSCGQCRAGVKLL